MSVLHRYRRQLAISIALAMLVYLGAMLFHDGDAVIGALRSVSPALVSGLLALSLVNYLVRFLRWHRYLGLFGHPVPWRPDLFAYIGGFALTTTPGKAGEAIRSLLLQKHGVPASASLAALFAERVFDLVAVLGLAALGLSAHPALFAPMAAVALALVAAVALVQTRFALEMLARFGERRTGLVRNAVEGLIGILSRSRAAFQGRMLPYGLGLGLIAWAAEGFGLWLLLHALGTPIPVPSALFIYATAMLAGAITFLPGGLGGTEAAMMVLLIGEGVPNSSAVVATVVVRLATLWFAVLLGAGILTVWGRRAEAPAQGPDR